MAWITRINERGRSGGSAEAAAGSDAVLGFTHLAQGANLIPLRGAQQCWGLCQVPPVPFLGKQPLEDKGRAEDGDGFSFCLSKESGEAAPCLGLLQRDVCEQGKAGGGWSWGLWWVTLLLLWSEGISCRAWLSHCSLLPEKYFQSKSHHCSLCESLHGDCKGCLSLHPQAHLDIAPNTGISLGHQPSEPLQMCRGLD